MIGKTTKLSSIFLFPGMLFNQRNVFILYPEKITFTNAPSPQEFTEGDNAIIICDVISSPPPTVIWKYKGSKIQMEKDGKGYLNALFLFHLMS